MFLCVVFLRRPNSKAKTVSTHEKMSTQRMSTQRKIDCMIKIFREIFGSLGSLSMWIVMSANSSRCKKSQVCENFRVQIGKLIL